MIRSLSKSHVSCSAVGAIFANYSKVDIGGASIFAARSAETYDLSWGALHASNGGEQ